MKYKFRNPIDSAESSLIFTLIEDRDSRVLVECNNLSGVFGAIKPQFVYLKSDLVADFGLIIEDEMPIEQAKVIHDCANKNSHKVLVQEIGRGLEQVTCNKCGYMFTTIA